MPKPRRAEGAALLARRVKGLHESHTLYHIRWAEADRELPIFDRDIWSGLHSSRVASCSAAWRRSGDPLMLGPGSRKASLSLLRL